MKILKRLIFLLPLLTLFFITGCGPKDSKVKIGIIQIVEHESLDSARNGFIDGLKDFGYEEGRNVEFDVQIAGGDLSNCASIAQKFVNDKKDLILAVSTPCAQAVANVTKEVPILATAITDFESTGMIESKEHPGSNVTGTSDLVPIDKIIELIPKLKPDAKKVGILYSTTDPSPQCQAELAEKCVKKLGLESKMATVSQSHEIQQITEKLGKEVDALYIPIDKITFSAMPQISEIFLKNGKFVVSAEDTMISKGVIATYGVNYYELGKLTAQQAMKILKGESKPGDMPIQYLEDAKLSLNKEIIKKLGIRVPEDLEGCLK